MRLFLRWVLCGEGETPLMEHLHSPVHVSWLRRLVITLDLDGIRCLVNLKPVPVVAMTIVKLVAGETFK